LTTKDKAVKLLVRTRAFTHLSITVVKLTFTYGFAFIHKTQHYRIVFIFLLHLEHKMALNKTTKSISYDVIKLKSNESVSQCEQA